MIDLIIEAGSTAGGAVGETGVARIRLAPERPGPVEARGPGAVARLVNRRLGRHRLEHWGQRGFRTVIQLSVIGHAIGVLGLAIPPERALLHHCPDEDVAGTERGFLRAARA